MEKKLYRSSRQQVIAGVCGGIGEYFDIDVTIVRLAWAAAFFLGGTGLLIYIIAAIIIPKNPTYINNTVNDGEHAGETVIQDNYSVQEAPVKNNSVLIIGLIMIVLGTVALFNRFIPIDLFRSLRDLGWPIILILVGCIIMYSAAKKK